MERPHDDTHPWEASPDDVRRRQRHGSECLQLILAGRKRCAAQLHDVLIVGVTVWFVVQLVLEFV